MKKLQLTGHVANPIEIHCQLISNLGVDWITSHSFHTTGREVNHLPFCVTSLWLNNYFVKILRFPGKHVFYFVPFECEAIK